MEEIKYSYDIGKFADILNRVIFRDYPHRAKDFVESFISVMLVIISLVSTNLCNASLQSDIAYFILLSIAT